MVNSDHKRLKVAFLLAESFTLSAFANFVDVLRLAADEADRSRPILCDWGVLSDTMNPVRSSCGVRVSPDTRLRDAGAYDYVIVVGGLMSEETGLSAPMTTFLQDRAAKGTPLIGLCTGVFHLQEAGLLAGYRCCVSWFHHQDFLDRFETERPVSDQIFVVDRDRLTCSGGHGAAHLAAHLVSRHLGQSAAIKSLNIMMIDNALGGDRPQPGQSLDRQPRDPLVKRAVLLMQQNIEVPLTVAALADRLDTPRRTLLRRFEADLAASPSRVYMDLRLDRALSKLASSDAPIPEVAQLCGFCDSAHLSKTLKQDRGWTPSQYRAAKRAAPPQP
ncbi:GlxA family transcriptional regulator [Tropicibacter naphthalenivorans]|uniref:Carnitine catabolism transcriptional activator n=1 Tax=Tropicibacter naphthalenivorans TaxID=441103 RepID=A0A0P1GWN1_9RHOB|nr:GlxA family transcriptional regulator [Tropicibacter naphthalenivorans]CUH80694.1 Carnitine catabolism transcriptional activator [Tropicibacter naphthalenivorans]SMC89416.1 transcriptional regulator, AraC family with amidase-like domain [Tropicibacter naphthalenivorans]